MYKSKIETILESQLSQHNVQLDGKQRMAVLEAMVSYGVNAVEKYRSNEIKAVSLEQVRFLPALFDGSLKLWLRKINFNRAKKVAEDRARIENRKMYCIRISDIKYVVISSREVDYLKKVMTFKKSVSFLTLSEISDHIAYPKQ